MIEKYGNKHTIDNFKGRTAYIDKTSSGGGTPTSNKNSNSKAVDDFGTAFIETHKKKLQKKNTHLGIGSFADDF